MQHVKVRGYGYRIDFFGGLFYKNNYHWIYIGIGDKARVYGKGNSGSIIDINYIKTTGNMRSQFSYVDTWLRVLHRWYGV